MGDITYLKTGQGWLYLATVIDLCTITDAEGRLRHELTATARNHPWMTAITEHHTGEGKMSLCTVKVAYSSRIDGYLISSKLKVRLTVDVFDMAAARRGDVAGGVAHSDRGSQIRVKELRSRLGSSWPGQLDGQSRYCRGQRGYGKLFRNVAEERSRPLLMALPGPVENRNSDLDRADISPTAATSPLESIDTRGVTKQS